MRRRARSYFTGTHIVVPNVIAIVGFCEHHIPAICGILVLKLLNFRIAMLTGLNRDYLNPVILRPFAGRQRPDAGLRITAGCRIKNQHFHFIRIRLIRNTLFVSQIIQPPANIRQIIFLNLRPGHARQQSKNRQPNQQNRPNSFHLKNLPYCNLTYILLSLRHIVNIKKIF